MAQAKNLQAASDRIEALIAELQTFSDPGERTVAEIAEELVRLLIEFYGAGLARILEIARRSADAGTLLGRFERDELVASLLAVHGLHPQEEKESGPLVQIGAGRKSAPGNGSKAGEAPHASERCELCAQPISHHHSHLVHVEDRNLLCACRPCYLLFTAQGAAGGKYRAVPERCVDLGDQVLDPAQWDRLQIPVSLAFFFFNSSLGRTVAFYPSPAGATESLLPLETWEEIVRANPGVAALTPDVEALLVWKQPEGCASYAVPIDACYELVGIVRRHWRGFHGGEEAWTAIEAFFDGLAVRSEPVASGAASGG